MASKEQRDVMRAKAMRERDLRQCMYDKIIGHWKATGEFSFAVRSDWPEPPWPDGPFPRAICDQTCSVTVASEKTEMTIDQMLNVHEATAVACGRKGCKSRGHGVSNDLSCDGMIVREALEFLIGEGMIRLNADVGDGSRSASS
jgi:hypothetical protein